jgi:hypothetical protein
MTTPLKSMSLANLKIKLNAHDKKLKTKATYSEREHDRQMIKDIKEEINKRLNVCTIIDMEFYEGMF